MTRRLLCRALSIAPLLTVVACGSSDFSVAPPANGDAEIADTSGGGDTAGARPDTAPVRDDGTSVEGSVGDAGASDVTFGDALPPSCPPNLVACSGTCVDVSNDSNNCGKCNVVCPTTSSCVSGNCTGVPVCPVGKTNCPTTANPVNCVDLQTDPNNCGQCKRGVCQGNEKCSAGKPACREGFTACGDPALSCEACRETNSDPAACGGCVGAGGHRCDVSHRCFNGQCTPTTCNGAYPDECPFSIGNGLKTGGCVDKDTDPTQCGTCGNPCAAAENCVSGKCTPM